MKINPAIFKAYDIRGIYPDYVNSDTIRAITKAIYTFFLQQTKKDALTIALGRDMRVSSPELFEIAKKALVSLGATVADIGLVPTPTLYYSVLSNRFDAGIQVSASHNPKEYNGIKFVLRKGDKIIKIAKRTGMDTVKEIALSNSFAKEKSGGTVKEYPRELEKEIEDAFSSVSPTLIKPFTVVVDPANAMGAPLIEAVFNKLPCKLIKMNFDLDGTFPAHQPDPLQFKLLKDLQERVMKENADLGIAPDGDGDRVFFVDEKGSIVPATLISALVVNELLQKESNKKVIVDIRYTRNVQSAVNKLGGSVSTSPVGHSLITDQLNKEDAVFAGESSGHYYFKETGGAESTARVIFYVLSVLSREGKPLSEILSSFSSSFESGEFNFALNGGVTKEKVFSALQQNYSDGVFIDLDGIAIEYPNWRFSVRASNTEPLIRLNVEGESKLLVEEKLKDLKLLIINIGSTEKK